MQNAVGMKDGKPLVGSSWRYSGDSGWDVLSINGDRATIMGRLSKGTTGAALSEFGVKYTFLAYPNEAGLDARGRPLNGSKWRLMEDDLYFKHERPLYTVEPGERCGGVPLVGGSWGGTDSFKDARIWRLIELPPQPAQPKVEGELEWKPLDREMLRLEQRARTWEEKGQLLEAKGARRLAHALVEMDARIAAEESALKEHRYIAKALLKKLTPGDRACYEMKGLKEFKAHAAEAAEYLYWD